MTESVTSEFSNWILVQKGRKRPAGLFVVGVNGSVGQGKSVFSQAIVSHLNALLKPEEGRAVTRSLDDYYLTYAERARPEFQAMGYAPSGISNRGPAGTHDTVMLLRDIQGMETGDGPFALPSFDKVTDDRSPIPFRVLGKAGVFILEGWFVGCRTEVDIEKVEPGLKRSVALALKNYKPIFDRLDALWAFEPLASREDIVTQRVEQEETLRKSTGKPGMTPDQIRRMVNYFYRDSWQEGVSSPVPPRESADFWAARDLHHQFLSVRSR